MFRFYIRNQNKIILLPLALIAISLIVILLTYVRTGDIVEKDVTLKGGVTITLHKDVNANELEKRLNDRLKVDVIVRQISELGTEKQSGVVIEADMDVKELKQAVEDIAEIKLTPENSSVEVTGSTLGESFYRQMFIAIIVAFLLMAIVVFLVFKDLIPSAAVVLAAFSDIIVTIAVINVIGIKLSTSGIAAILLLLGYSVDTDILLTTRVLKRKEGMISDRLAGAIKTGLTMTATTIVALTVGYLFSNSIVLRQMFMIIIIGLLTDIIMTYMLNAPIIMRHAKRKEHG